MVQKGKYEILLRIRIRLRIPRPYTAEDCPAIKLTQSLPLGKED